MQRGRAGGWRICAVVVCRAGLRVALADGAALAAAGGAPLIDGALCCPVELDGCGPPASRWRVSYQDLRRSGPTQSRRHVVRARCAWSLEGSGTARELVVTLEKAQQGPSWEFLVK